MSRFLGAVSIIALSVAGCVLLLRSVGLLQSLEWAALDQFFRLRPPEPVDERIVIVAIDEDDLRKVGQWPLPDTVIAQLLQKLHAKKPCFFERAVASISTIAF